MCCLGQHQNFGNVSLQCIITQYVLTMSDLRKTLIIFISWPPDRGVNLTNGRHPSTILQNRWHVITCWVMLERHWVPQSSKCHWGGVEGCLFQECFVFRSLCSVKHQGRISPFSHFSHDYLMHIARKKWNRRWGTSKNKMPTRLGISFLEMPWLLWRRIKLVNAPS